MIVNLYSVRDKLLEYACPIAFNNDDMAKRWFTAYCRQKSHEKVDPFYYDLYKVGAFDTEKGNTIGSAVAEVELIMEGENINEQTDEG